MNRKIIILICFLVLFGVFIATYHIQTVEADSGFDTSYDSGGSDFGGGSDWDSDSSGGGSMSLPFVIMMIYIFGSPVGLAFVSNFFDKKQKNYLEGIILSIVFVILLLWLNYIMYKTSESILESTLTIVISNIIVVPMLISLLIPRKKEKVKKAELENVDEKVQEAFNIYKDLQYAWSDFNYNKIKELVNDEIYNMYINQLDTLKVKNQKNVMSEISFVDGRVRDSKIVNNKEIIDIFLVVRCHDYIISTKNNKVVRGSKNGLLTLSYFLTFERNIKVVKNCPQCGSPLENQTVCPYCKSKVVNNNSTMKLTKKQMVSQK